jgi:hypothetical protein
MHHVDSPLYEKAASELAAKIADRGLLAKAFSISMGDEARSKALYIQFRVDQLKSEAAAAAVAAGEKLRAEMMRVTAEKRARKDSQKVNPAIQPPKQSDMRFP